MKLKILLKNVKCKEKLSEIDHINNGYFEPHYQTCIGNVEQEINVVPTTEDYVRFFLEKADTTIVCSKGEIKSLVKLFDDGYFKNWFNDSLEELEYNEDFIKFMEERYYDKALEEYGMGE